MKAIPGNTRVTFRIFAFCILAALAPSLAGCFSKTAEDHLRAAEAMQKKEKWEESIIELKNAAQKDPRNGLIRYRLGIAYNEVQNSRGAEAELRRAREFGLLEGGRVVAEITRALVADRRFGPVLEDATLKPIASFEEDAGATIHAMRARALLAMRRFNDARAAVEEAVKLKPDSVDAAVSDAMIKAASHGWDAALAVTERILSARPNHFDNLLLRADILRARGDVEGALAVYQKLLTLRPRFVPALTARSSLYFSQDRIPEAQKDIAAIRRIAKNHPAASYMQAMIQFRAGKYSDAQGSIQQVLRFKPNYPQALLLSGAIHHALGSFAQAEVALTQFLQIEPSSGYARKLLASTLIELKQGKRALEVIQPMIGRNLQDATIMALAGDAYSQVGDFAAANQFLTKAADIDPKAVHLRLGLARSRMAAGDIAGGIADLEAASELDAKGFEAEYELIMTHLARREYDKAIQAADLFRKKAPNSPAPHNYLGVAYLGKKDIASARKSFEQALAIDAAYFPAAANLVELDLQDKRPGDARKRLESVLAKNPKHVRALMGLAHLSLETKNTAEYLKWLERAAAADPAALEPHLELANYFLSAGQPKRALEAARAAEKVAPKNPRALEAVGVVQIANGDFNVALTTFTRAAALAPRSATAHYRVASARAKVNDRAGAEAALKKALELEPDFILAKETLGQLYLLDKRVPDAIKLAQDMQKKHRKTPVGFVLEGDALTMQKKYGPALKAYEAAAAIAPSGDLAVRRYMALARDGRATAGEEILAKWLGEHPNDGIVRHYLADAYLQTGRSKLAAQQYELIVKADADDALALNNLAGAYQEMKDPRALAAAERAYKLMPENPLIADTLGWLVLNNGDLKRGLELIRFAAGKSPKVASIRYHLAVALHKSGDRAGARKELEGLLANHKQFPELEQARALLGQL